VNAQLKYTVPADQPYSQPFWLREPKQGDTYTISDQRWWVCPTIRRC
jgi:hypothetical protein